MIDLSINFPISKEIRQKIVKVQEVSKLVDKSQIFIPELKLHCTVKSCGLIGKQINEDNIPQIIETAKRLLDDFKQFKVQLKGLQSFPNTVYINVISKDSKLKELHNLLNENIKYSEYQEFEGEGYKPHTTIIELINKSPNLLTEIDKYKDYNFGEMTVDTINVILGGEAAPKDRFKILKSFQLKAEPE